MQKEALSEHYLPKIGAFQKRLTSVKFPSREISSYH